MATITSRRPPAPETEVPSLSGLTEAEVVARRKQGLGNNIKLETSRSYADIVRYNVFNLINVILFSIGAIMIAIGRVGDAFTSVGLIALNVVIGIYQEVRAKRQLDRIALLTRPRVNVIRSNTEQVIDPSDLVMGDIVVLRAGDQVVVDGVLVSNSKLDVDESLLTGESDLITKLTGDEVLSGSFCATGSGLYEATRVGKESFANKLTSNARKFQIAHTPLQTEVNLLLRLLMLLAGFLGFLMILSTIISSAPFMRQVQMAAVIVGLVPNGLFLMVIIAYAMGALRIVQQGALVQQANAVESLSNVTVLCMDKTGTLTANRIHYEASFPVGISTSELEALLGIFAKSATNQNKTGEALASALSGTAHKPVDEVAFSSARKWSALAFTDAELHGTYVLGALEMLDANLSLDQGVHQQVQEWSDQGLRVLVFAHNAHVTALHDHEEQPVLPELTVLGILAFSDELRPNLRETLAQFIENGITLKVISGDNPQTVAALTRQAGFPGDLKYVSGTELDRLTDAEIEVVAQETTIFGRITPEQKERLVGALKRSGHYVAMIGDGVNDVLSLKKANMGIAMESGSAATRSVADMILLNDSFSALPYAFTEGQRIVNGMKDILRLFLTRVSYSALLILSTAVIGLGFPYVPKHNALIVMLTVGIPTLALAVWARPGPMPRQGMLREVRHFIIPASFSVFFFGLMVYVSAFYGGVIQLLDYDVTPADIASFQEYVGIDYAIVDADQYIVEVAHLAAQTALTTFIVFSGVLLIVFVEPPTQFFTGGDQLSGDWRPTIMAGVMFLTYLIIINTESLRSFFELVELPFIAYLLIALVTAIWLLTLRAAWRNHWIERFLGLPVPQGQGATA